MRQVGIAKDRPGSPVCCIKLDSFSSLGQTSLDRSYPLLIVFRAFLPHDNGQVSQCYFVLSLRRNLIIKDTPSSFTNEFT